MQRTKTRCLIEASLMVALATVLSVFKIVEMPYGGSVTLGSMLPLIILSYRNGYRWGLGGALVYSLIQQLLGLKNLSYFTTWQSIVAIILLDYVIAFTLVGIGGMYRGKIKSQSTALAVGAVTVGILRYLCHVISGATVWAGLSIPDAAALYYSIGYNATYMLPETVVLAALAYYVGDTVDFTRVVPSRTQRGRSGGKSAALISLGGLLLLLGFIVDVVLIAPHLQDAESGMFVLSGLRDANWLAVGIVSLVSLAASVPLITVGLNAERKNSDA